MSALLLSASDVRLCLPMNRAVEAVEAAFAAFGRGEARMPKKIYLDVPGEEGDFRAMPGYLGATAGLKWVDVHPQNPARFGKPAVRGLLLLNDPKDGELLAVMDATWLTAIRTGAAGAVASKHLAVARPRSLGLVGAGVQARTLLAGHRAVFGADFEVIVHDADRTRAEALAEEAGGRVGTIAEVGHADVVCTCTPARAPVLPLEALGKSTHVNAMGADAPGKQELDPAILRAARVYVDDPIQALHSGEINVPTRDGLYRPDEIAASLGEVVSGRRDVRRGVGPTVFDSTGLSIQDIAVATVVLEEARARQLGTAFDFAG